MDEYSDDQQFPPVTELSSLQRRVLGTLIEKALTTPDQYPMTLKGATTGCNQKSNREPVVNYREDDVQRGLDELREMGLVAVVLSGGGRTERYRHYVRKRFPFSEQQIAIMTELWLRGRQQPGELRTRASRMVPIESQEALRVELDGLLAGGYLQADGPLDRRGIEVDHNFYRPGEAKLMQFSATAPESAPSEPAARPSTGTVTASGGASSLEQAVAALQRQQLELQQEVGELRDQLRDLADALQNLKRELGV